MNQYGVKIKNISSGSIEEVEQGVRDIYDYTEAMLTNSLFLDFLKSNGLKIYKGSTTRQVIGVTFDYGTRSYDEERKHIDKLITERGENEKLIQLRDQCEANKDKYKHLSPAEVREKFYIEGCTIKYKNETIHYKMLYRSVGKAKKGLCMFIDQRLYKKAHDFLWMGIKLPKKNAPIVEIGAYSSLITSTIIDKIQINPDDVLILKDVDSFFKTDVVSVETDKDRHCYTKELSDYEVCNTMFDGQALIDSSIFPSWADGFILLRQHFTKCAAFCTNIQLFFRDYFGDEYETKTIPDMFGNEHRVKDIKMITTHNAIKWCKFDISYEYWKERVLANGGFWGIVKTSHESKLGDAQRMSYQMVNTLNENIMESVMQPSINYVTKLKSDTNAYIDFLRRNVTFTNDYDVLIALYEQDHSFEFSTYWKNRKTSIIDTYVTDLKNGRLRQEADNCTIVGSPYAMLLHAVGENVENDKTLVPEAGAIQCYSERFKHDEYLASFRSPHNAQANVGYLHNIRSAEIERYFNLGTLCVAVNVQHTDFQPRHNGSDSDGDVIYLTNQTEIVNHAKYCYQTYHTVVNNIPQEKNHYNNVLKDYAFIDDRLAASQLAIGESSNLAQLALTYGHTFNNKKYGDYANILAVIAQVSIDSSKKSFDIDISAEIEHIRKQLDIETNLFPEFWKATSMRGIRKQFKDCVAQSQQVQKVRDKINYELHCPMNMCYSIAIPRVTVNTHTKGMDEFFVKQGCPDNIKVNKHVENLISKYSLELYNNRVNSYLEDRDDYLLYREDFEDMIEDIRRTVLPSKYIGLFSWLIDRAFIITPPIIRNKRKLSTALHKNRPLLLKVLYTVNPEALLACFSKNIKKG